MAKSHVELRWLAQAATLREFVDVLRECLQLEPLYGFGDWASDDARPLKIVQRDG